jgi:hypothetical protein
VVHQGNEVRPARAPNQLRPQTSASAYVSRPSRWLALGWLGCVALAALGSCAPIVRYTSELVDERHGRTWFTRLPSSIGGTLGFAVGVPIDIVALPVAVVVHSSQPKETRDPLSVFLFPSFVLWKVGTLFGAPFDGVEWATYRSWQAPEPVTPEDREAIERKWDAREFSEYPVTPIYPLGTASGQD